MTTHVHRKKAVWGPKRIITATVALAVFIAVPSADAADRRHGREGDRKGENRRAKGRAQNTVAKFDPVLMKRAGRWQGTTPIIFELGPGYEGALQVLQNNGATFGPTLGIINSYSAEVPNSLLSWIARHPGFVKVRYDRPTSAENYRTAITTGALSARQDFGYTGQGIGVAVVDSGITSWHNDLMGYGGYGYQRVSKFVDFVNGLTLPYDDNGHGTHVAGIIGGSGYNSFGQKAGIAPKVSLVVLKVLDRNGQGSISRIIAALDWIVANKNTYNIRVANLSLGAGVYESYSTDPLTLAAKRAVQAGVVVVGASGNIGRDRQGHTQYGGITAPGNAPWVLTVGASSTMGTLVRTDDTMAGYSSRGPTYIDYAAKPDLVAPGTGTVSLSDPASLFYATKSNFLTAGSFPLSYMPYLSLSGTSMSAPVVAGSVALMLQANPSLTPNAVKAILQYTAQIYPNYDFLTQGAGFLNTYGAVRLAQFLRTMQPGDVYPTKSVWAKHIIWGNHRLRGGVIVFNGSNAYASNVVWGNAFTDAGDNVVWGNLCGAGDCDNVVWGNASGDDNVVWGNSVDANDNVVWGNAADDNIVWGNDCGGADCDNVVWGNTDDDNVVWGNADGEDNVVWGNTGFDNVVWGNSDADDNVVWGNSGEEATVFSDRIDPAEAGLTFDELFGPAAPASGAGGSNDDDAPPPADITLVAAAWFPIDGQSARMRGVL